MAEPKFNPKSLHTHPETPSHHRTPQPAILPPHVETETQRRVGGKFMRKLVSQIQVDDSQPPALSTSPSFCTEEKVTQILSEGSQPLLSACTWPVASLEGRCGNDAMWRLPACPPWPGFPCILRALPSRLGENSPAVSFHLQLLLPPVSGTVWSRGPPAGVAGRKKGTWLEPGSTPTLVSQHGASGSL